MKSVLAIETSCDDTSLAHVSYKNNSFQVEKILSYSQISEHQQYGGVVPEIAYRVHSEKILPLLRQFDIEKNTYDAIVVTGSPGLPGSLIVGKAIASMVSIKKNIPLFHINHIHGHIFSLLLERGFAELPFPWVVLSVSGGHNDLYLIDYESNQNGISMQNIRIQQLGKTLDDAGGEAFDKVSRMIGGPYPGGAWIGDMAKGGETDNRIQFKKVQLSKSEHMFDFSFSGYKAQSGQIIQKVFGGSDTMTEQDKKNFCYTFQNAVSSALVEKLYLAVEMYKPRTVGIVGGVSANDVLIQHAQAVLGREVIRPTKKVYSTDNAAMIGAVGLLTIGLSL